MTDSRAFAVTVDGAADAAAVVDALLARSRQPYCPVVTSTWRAGPDELSLRARTTSAAQECGEGGAHRIGGLPGNPVGRHEAEIGEADPNWPDWYAQYMADEMVGQDAEHEPAGA